MIYLTFVFCGVLCIAMMSGIFAHWLDREYRQVTRALMLRHNRELTGSRKDLRRLMALADVPREDVDSTPTYQRLLDLVTAFSSGGVSADDISVSLDIPVSVVRAMLPASCSCAVQGCTGDHWEDPLISLVPPTSMLPLYGEETQALPALDVEAGQVPCPTCNAETGRPCRYVVSGSVMGVSHWSRWHAFGQPCPTGCPDCPNMFGRGSTPGQVTFGATFPGAGDAAGGDSTSAPGQCWCGPDREQCPDGSSESCSSAATEAELLTLIGGEPAVVSRETESIRIEPSPFMRAVVGASLADDDAELAELLTIGGQGPDVVSRETASGQGVGESATSRADVV